MPNLSLAVHAYSIFNSSQIITIKALLWPICLSVGWLVCMSVELKRQERSQKQSWGNSGHKKVTCYVYDNNNSMAYKKS